MQLTLPRTLLVHALLLLGIVGTLVGYRHLHPPQMQIEEMPPPTPEEMAEMQRLMKVVSRSILYGGSKPSYGGSEVVKAYRDLIALQERYLVPEHPEIMPYRQELARMLESHDRYVQAEKEYAVVLDILQRVMGAAAPETVEWQKEYTELHRRTVALVEKEQTLRQACKAREQAPGNEHHSLLVADYAQLALCLREVADQQEEPLKLQEALELMKRAEALQIKFDGTGSPYVKSLIQNIEAELRRLPAK